MKQRVFPSSERGSVLILVVLLVSLLAFIPVGTQLLKTARTKVKQQANVETQALNVARAGLQDAVGWFRRQNNGQPVRQFGTSYAYPDAAFFPRESTGDTMNESIGLVKEEALGEANNLWYRYEVVRQSVNNVISTSSYNSRAVHDVTGQRIEGFSTGSGLAWYIESAGYVFNRRDPSKRFDEEPNRVVGRARVGTEIRRLNLSPTAKAAVIIANRGNGTVNADTLVAGGSTNTVNSGIGVACTGGSGGTWGESSSPRRTIGNPPIQSSSTFTTNLSSIFGLTPYEMRLVADVSVDNVSQLPNPFPRMGIVYINGAATLDASNPLRGGGVLIVNGNLTIPSGTFALYSGLIHVTGNVVINGPASIAGTLVVTGSLTLNSGSDTVSIQFDEDALALVSQEVARYRENRATYHVFSAFKQ